MCMWVCVFVLVGRLSSAAEFWCFPFTLLFARFVVVMQKRKESFDDKHMVVVDCTVAMVWPL